MMGRIIMGNGKESVFFLTESDVEVLEQEAAETRVLDVKHSYTIADVLAEDAIKNWVNRLRIVQGRKEKTPGGATPRGSNI